MQPMPYRVPLFVAPVQEQPQPQAMEHHAHLEAQHLEVQQLPRHPASVDEERLVRAPTLTLTRSTPATDERCSSRTTVERRHAPFFSCMRPGASSQRTLVSRTPLDCIVPCLRIPVPLQARLSLAGKPVAALHLHLLL